MTDMLDTNSENYSLENLYTDLRTLRDQLKEVGVTQNIGLINYALGMYGQSYPGNLYQKLVDVLRYNNIIKPEKEEEFIKLAYQLGSKLAEFHLYLEVNRDDWEKWPEDLR